MVTEDTLSIFLYWKSVHTYTVFALSWTVETIFDNVWTAKLPRVKEAYYVNKTF